MKKIIIGLVCVLAAVAAAQPALAQHISHAERAAITEACQALQQNNGKNQGEAKSAPRAEQKNTGEKFPYQMAGREMKIVNSSEYMAGTACYIGKKCWEGLCKAGRTCKEIVKTAGRNYAKYGPGGREGAMMRGGEYLYKHVKSKKQQNKIQEQQNSLKKALEQAAAQAAEKAAQK